MRRPAFLFLVAATLLVGCGGGEGGEEAEIRETIEASSTSRDPADCRRYSTINLLQQVHKVQGEAAVRACEESAIEPHELPSAVEVTRIEIDGDRATAQVAALDGPFDEQELAYALVEEAGSWKGDEILGFAVFDRDAFLLEFGREVMGNARTPAQALASACVVGLMERMSDAELEALVLGPSTQPIDDLARPCEPRSQAL